MRIDAPRAEAACLRAIQEQPLPRFYYQLGWALQTGGKSREAVENFRIAADQGYAPAQATMGWIKEKGQGVILKDADQAISWYRKAADQGNTGAQYSLGVMTIEGRGVPRDDTAGAALVMKAAEQGFAPAQYMVGVLYEKGRGFPHDDDQAGAWFSKAAANGSADAMAALKDRKLTGQASAVGAAIIGLGVGAIAAGIIADSDPSSPPAPKTSEYDRELERQRLDHRLRCDQGQTFFCGWP
jgi:TPR repeat protein